MPYRRGYVPPLPDFSKTGMSYSTEGDEAEDGPGETTLIRKGTKKSSCRWNFKGFFMFSDIYLESPGGCRGNSVLEASWTSGSRFKTNKRKE